MRKIGIVALAEERDNEEKYFKKRKKYKPLKTLDENFLSTDYKLKSLLYLKTVSFIKSKNSSLKRKYNKTTKKKSNYRIKKEEKLIDSYFQP